MIRLKADNLEKRFGQKTVFSDVSLDTEATVLGVAGINGSGKSTLLRCLTGLIKPTLGAVEWAIDGKKIKKTDLKNFLGFAAPYIQLYEELTVRENLQFIQNVRSLEQTVPVEKLLEPLGAESFCDLHFGELSTGQQQRIKLAAAIIHEPEILVLDEPGSNLDKAGKQIVQNLVEEFSTQNRMIIIASNQNDELNLCKEIIELSKT